MSSPIYIPKPCHENWNSMTPQEQGRHCGVCSKVVKDYTSMKNEEIIESLKGSKTGEVCGRINVNQLTPTNKKQKVYFWMNGVLMRKGIMAFMGLLGLSFVTKKAHAQMMGRMPVKGKIAVNNETETKKLNLVIKTTGGNGNVAGAMISFGSGTSKNQIFTTDHLGRISIDFDPEEILAKQIEINITADGFQQKTIRVQLVKTVQTVEVKMEEAFMIMGEMMYIPEEHEKNTPVEKTDTSSVLPADTIKTSCTNDKSDLLRLEPGKLVLIPTNLLDKKIINPSHLSLIKVSDDLTDRKIVETDPFLSFSATGEDPAFTPTLTEERVSGYDLFPLPAKDMVTIRSTRENGDIFGIEIFDQSGRKIHTVINIYQRYQLDVSEYAAGMYYMVVQVKNQAVETKKLVVQ